MIVEDCGNFSDYQTCNFGKDLEKEDENGPRSYRVVKSTQFGLEIKLKILQIGENLFELSAGSFIRSAYK
jgi:hypothetical protein